MPHLAVLLLSLACLVILVRLRLEFGWAMLASALVLGAVGGLGPPALARAFAASWVNGTTIDLLASLLSILLLENVLRNQGYLQRVLSSLRALFRDARVVMASCAAFLGLLPSAGGAVLSAPMVEEAAVGLDLTPEDKSAINYWYRHVWEYCLPLYPGLILAAKTVDIPLARLAPLMAPFTLLSVVIGIPLMFWRVKTPPRKMEPTARSGRGKGREVLHLFRGVAPVLVVIGGVVGLGLEVWQTVMGVILVLLAVHRYRPAALIKLLREAISLRTILLVAGVMAYRGMLGATGIVEALPKIFAAAGLPPFFLVVTIPMILGALTGLSQAFVGAAFPLLMGILGHGTQARIGLVALAFVSGFSGVMLTPVHLCLVLTLQYFRARLGPVWLRYMPGTAAILLLAIVYALVI